MGYGKVMIDVIYEDNMVIVLNKKINIPMQKDSSGDMDLLTLTKNYIKEKYNKKGDVYLGLVHRLDRPVGGIVVFARNSKAASRLSKQIANNEFIKEYYAVIDGKTKKNDILEDYLLKNSKTNTSIVDESGKYSKLEYEQLAYKNNLSLVKIRLYTGRSHQIRVQFSSRNMPLYGDQRYNNKSTIGEQIALLAISLSFIHPVKKERMSFNIDMPNTYPWSIFKS